MNHKLMLYTHRENSSFGDNEYSILKKYNCISVHKGSRTFYRSSVPIDKNGIPIRDYCWTNFYVIENLNDEEDRLVLSLIGMLFPLADTALDNINYGIYDIDTTPEIFDAAVTFCRS